MELEPIPLCFLLVDVIFLSSIEGHVHAPLFIVAFFS